MFFPRLALGQGCHFCERKNSSLGQFAQIGPAVPASRNPRQADLALGRGRLRDALQGFSRQLLVACLHGQVAERDDTGQPLLAV
jgi:hypothetical protein